jgi:hypothetical protein
LLYKTALHCLDNLLFILHSRTLARRKGNSSVFNQ